MKNEFKAFYNRDDSELKKIWNSKHTLFVFDTNVLLNLYSYSQDTQQDFFSLLESIQDKIWIPHHVGLEYQRRRIEVVKDEKKIFNELDKLEILDKSKISDLNRLCPKKRNLELYEKKTKLIEEINKLISTFKDEVKSFDKEQPNVNSKDRIRENLDRLFDKKIGSKPENQDWLDNLYQDGNTRYEKAIPPGFKDSTKENDFNDSFEAFGYNYKRKFGDLIIWKQLIDYCKNNETINFVILITDDTKEDWWQIIESNGEKYLGARRELKEEIYSETKNRIDYFHMYQTSEFLRYAKEFNMVDIDEKSISETFEIHLLNSSLSDYLSDDIKLWHKHSIKEMNLNNSEKLNDEILARIKSEKTLKQIIKSNENNIIKLRELKTRLESIENKIIEIEFNIAKHEKAMSNSYNSAFDLEDRTIAKEFFRIAREHEESFNFLQKELKILNQEKNLILEELIPLEKQDELKDKLSDYLFNKKLL